MQTERKYLAAADVLRIFAIAAVGWYHFWQQSWLDPGFRIGEYYVNMQQMIRHGYIMVDILLVISGFLLALPYARAHFGLGTYPSAKEYYIKRFWRIVPSYAVGVLLCFFLYALPSGAYSSTGFMIKDLVSHLTFTHNLFYDTYFATPLQIVLWTMGVEVQFYAVFPLIARAYKAMPKLTCLALALIAFAYRLWVHNQSDTTLYVNQLPAMLDLYACGLLTAYLYEFLSRKTLRPGLRWLLALEMLFALLLLLQIMYLQPTGDYELMRQYQLLYRLPIGIVSAVFLLSGCLMPPGLARVLGNPLTRFLSAVSYNFYIWHQFLAVRLKLAHIPAYTAENPSMAGEQPWQLRYTLTCVAVGIFAAAFFTYHLEKPVARWGLRRTLKPSAPVTPAAEE